MTDGKLETMTVSVTMVDNEGAPLTAPKAVEMVRIGREWVNPSAGEFPLIHRGGIVGCTVVGEGWSSYIDMRSHRWAKMPRGSVVDLNDLRIEEAAITERRVAGREVGRLREAVNAALGYISADIDNDTDGNAYRVCQQLREALA